MNTVAANQQFAVHGLSVLHSGRLEWASNSPTLLQSNVAQAKKSNTTIVPEQRQTLANIALSAQQSKVATPTESTISAAQNEDKQSLRELQSADAVERILDQLSTGKLLSWIDGNSLEKIQAQVTEQQRANRQAVTDMPALTAQSIATSFGLDDSAALLNRLSRSGIFADAPPPASVQTSSHVDLNI